MVNCSWGEGSSDVDWLLSEAVECGAAHSSSSQPAEDDEPDPLKAALARMLRRRWGIAALRANVRLLLERLAHVGRGAGAGTSTWFYALAPSCAVGDAWPSDLARSAVGIYVVRPHAGLRLILLCADVF